MPKKSWKTDASEFHEGGRVKWAKEGGYGFPGLGGAVDTPSEPAPKEPRGRADNAVSANGFPSGDDRSRQMPPRKGGNAAQMIMRIAKG